MHIASTFYFAILGLPVFVWALIQVPLDGLDLALQPDRATESLQQNKSLLDFDEADAYSDEDFDSDDDNYDSDTEDDFELDFEDDVEEAPSRNKAPKILYLPKDILTCGSSPFNPEAISAAMNAGLEIVQNRVPWKNKPREQPHWYNNWEGFDFPDCTEGRMFEFPILVGGQLHPGGRTGARARPGAHRVIFKADEDGGTFCGLITHEDALSTGSFVACAKSGI